MDRELRQLERKVAANPGDLEAQARYLAALRWTESKLMVECEHGPLPDHHSRAVLIARNGRWGTCGACPRREGGVRPEDCEYTDRYDHQLGCKHCHGTGKRRMPWPERFALAAYCGHPAARVLVPQCVPRKRSKLNTGTIRSWSVVDSETLQEWLAGPKRQGTDADGLARWPSTLLRAAVAAAECALLNWRSTCDELGQYGHAASMCNGCYQDSNRREEAEAEVTAARRYVEDPTAENLRAYSDLMSNWDRLPEWALHLVVDPARAIQAAAQLAKPEAVRAAICAELIAWSLGQSYP